MKPRTNFYLLGKKGIVYCSCGTIKDFVLDIENFILPILEDTITAEFNDVKINIHSYDTAETIYNKFKEKLWRN